MNSFINAHSNCSCGLDSQPHKASNPPSTVKNYISKQSLQTTDRKISGDFKINTPPHINIKISESCQAQHEKTSQIEGLQSELNEQDIVSEISDAMEDYNGSSPESSSWIMDESSNDFVSISYKLNSQAVPKFNCSQVVESGTLNPEARKPIEQNFSSSKQDHSVRENPEVTCLLDFHSPTTLHIIDTIIVKKASIFRDSFGYAVLEGSVKVKNTFYEPGTGAIVVEVPIEDKLHQFSLFYIHSEQKFNFPEKEFSVIGQLWRQRINQFDNKLNELNHFTSDLPNRTKRTIEQNKKILELVDFLEDQPKKTEIKPVDSVKTCCLDSRIDDVQDKQGRSLKEIIINRMQHHERNLKTRTIPLKHPAPGREIKYRDSSELFLQFNQKYEDRYINPITESQRIIFRLKVYTDAPMHLNQQEEYNDHETQACKLIDPVTFKGTFRDFQEERNKRTRQPCYGSREQEIPSNPVHPQVL